MYSPFSLESLVGCSRSALLRLTRLVAAIIVVLLNWGCFSEPNRSNQSGLSDTNSDVAELRRRAVLADSLRWLREAAGTHPWVRSGLTRSELVRAKQRSLASGDTLGAARVSGVFAAEAQVRAARVLDRWVERIDPESGLLPKGVTAEDQIWDYADAGADLYPHLVIAAALLRPDDLAPLRDVLLSEEAMVQPGQLPFDVNLGSGRVEHENLKAQIYGAVEYAKDGLLPLTERLGRGPWLDRMQRLANAVVRLAPVHTRFGAIPSDKSEVNGQTLQVLARLYWATGDDAYRLAAERIARAYLELALPDTDWLPTRTWDFEHERRNTGRVQLRDHGNEIVAGLVEYHLIETERGEPAAQKHRVQIRMMLDHLLAFGRTPEGLWRSAVDLDTGKPLQGMLSDNWGYLYSVYITQAIIEETRPGGDPVAASRYREAAKLGLTAAAQLDLYPWQGSEQDGYADTIESALYLLTELDEPGAANWVDRQAGTLFGAQDGDGRVEDRYLDGNFVRTALLYAAWQTHGVRLEPWRLDAMLGAAPDGPCLGVVVASGQNWQGRMIFDKPRHRLHLGLPLNYPRLNEWPEWFVVEPGHQYSVDDPRGDRSGIYDGTTLSHGLDLRLRGGVERSLRICA